MSDQIVVKDPITQLQAPCMSGPLWNSHQDSAINAFVDRNITSNESISIRYLLKTSSNITFKT